MAKFGLAGFSRLSIVVSTLALGVPAYAQDQQSTADGGVEDIIVTAQRRAESLQDVPIAVTSMSEATLDRANIASALDVGKLVSGVVFQQSTGTVTTFVRGLGNNQLAVGNEASVSLYIDGIYYARISPVMMRLNNVERVEVLKGPQGTLFGRNATGGLINVITSDPKPGAPPNARFMFGYGNFKTVEASAYLAGSLSDTLAASISVVNTHQGDGWGKNLLTGEETFKQEDFAVRGKLLFEPSDKTRLTLSADYSRSNSSIGLLGPYSGGLNPAPAGFGDGSGLIPVLASRYDKTSNLTDLADTRGWGGYARLEQELPFANLIATGALHDERITYYNDIDKTPLTYFHFREDDVVDNMRSGELQLFSKDGSPIKWQAGLYFLDHKFYFPNPAQIFGGAFGGVTVLATDGGRSKSYAGYGQATIPLTDMLGLTLGGRYNRDELSAFGRVDIAAGGVIIVPGTTSRDSTSFEKFTWRVALDYKPSDDLLLYASASRGFKAGVYNLITFSGEPIDPETIDAYEVGLKSELFDHRIRLNLAGFYYDYQNPQVQTQQPSGVTNLSNAGSAEIYGVEGEFEFVVTPELSLRGSATWLNAEYTDYADAPFYLPNPSPPFGLQPAFVGNANGNKLSRAPGFSGNIGGTYTADIGSGELAATVNYAYTGKFYWTPDNLLDQGDYGLLDAALSYSPADSGFTVQLWGSNLTNARYNLTANEFAGPVGVSSGPGAPRTYGFRFRYEY